MQVLKIVGIIAGVLLAIFSVYTLSTKSDSAEPQATNASAADSIATDPSSNTSLSSTNQSLDSFSTQGSTVVDSMSNNDTVALESDAASNSELSSSKDFPALDLFRIGTEDISDADLEALVERLNNDSESMSGLLNELSLEGDPDRVKRLLFVVGATKNEAVLPAAEEFLYSGDDALRDKGLKLLSRIAPVDPQAMLVARNLLVSETEPKVLMAAINVIAQPGNASTEARESVVPQITALMTHESASIRGFSLTTVSRLSNSADLAPVFYDGLFDAHPSVRNSAISALSGYPYRSAQANQKLLAMANDESEVLDVRQSAIRALAKNPPDDISQDQLDAISLQIRKEKRLRQINGN